MGEPIPLAEPQRKGDYEKRLRERLPNLADRLDALDVDPDEQFGQVLATRRHARELVAAHPDISGPVTLDARWAEVASPPFLHELLKAWPEATFINTNEDVAECIEIVRERLDRARTEGESE